MGVIVRKSFTERGKESTDMKSRLAVSVLFTLIAATFAPDAIGAFEKLRSWTDRLCDRRSTRGHNRASSHDSVPKSVLKVGNEDGTAMICLDGGQPLSQNCAVESQLRVVGAIAPDGKTMTLNSVDATKILSSHEGCLQGVVVKLAGSDHRSGSFVFIRTAARQIHEALDLMRIK
jgi:hypothetical protein